MVVVVMAGALMMGTVGVRVVAIMTTAVVLGEMVFVVKMVMLMVVMKTNPSCEPPALG